MKRTINGRRAMRPGGDHPNPTHWNDLIALKLAEQGNACACCPNDASSGYGLQLHHRHYENWGHEKPEDVVILCTLCHDAITDRFRFMDEYKVEGGVYAPLRPGLPEGGNHSESKPMQPVARVERPGLPPAEVDDVRKPEPTDERPKRIRPF